MILEKEINNYGLTRRSLGFIRNCPIRINLIGLRQDSERKNIETVRNC